MFVYNVTIKVNDSIKEDWLIWLKTTHIPEVMATGCFNGVTVHRLLDVDDQEGPTYIIQYQVGSRSNYDRYINEFAGTLRQRSFDKWGDQFIGFRSLLQVVE